MLPRAGLRTCANITSVETAKVLERLLIRCPARGGRARSTRCVLAELVVSCGCRTRTKGGRSRGARAQIVRLLLVASNHVGQRYRSEIHTCEMSSPSIPQAFCALPAFRPPTQSPTSHLSLLPSIAVLSSGEHTRAVATTIQRARHVQTRSLSRPPLRAAQTCPRDTCSAPNGTPDASFVHEAGDPANIRHPADGTRLPGRFRAQAAPRSEQDPAMYPDEHQE